MNKEYNLEDLEAVLDDLPYAFTLQNDEGKYLYVNNRLTKDLQLDKNDILGKYPKDLIGEKDAKLFNAGLNTIKNSGKGVFSVLKSKSDNRWYDVYRSFIHSNGKTFIASISNELNANMCRVYDNLLRIEDKDLIDFSDYSDTVYDNDNNQNAISDIEFRKRATLFCEDLQFKINADGVSIYLKDNNTDIIKLFASAGDNLKLCNVHKKVLFNSTNEFAKYNSKKLLKNCPKKCRLFYNTNKEKNWQASVHPIKHKSLIVGMIVVYYSNIKKIKYIADDFINSICHNLGIIYRNKNIRLELKKRRENKKILSEVEVKTSKINFYSNMSHEFRTPLNIILNSSQLMEMQLNARDFKKAKTNLKFIRQNSYRLLKLTNNIIDINKIHYDSYDFHPENCNIVEVIENIVMSVANYIKSVNNNIIFDTNQEEIITMCDISIIERIMLNLLSNALKYVNKNGSIKVTVTLDKNDNSVLVSVWDDGISISKEDSQRIFKKFSKIDNPITRRCEGGGVGLSLTKSLVEMHWGKIWVNTEVEHGAEIIFSFPIKKASKNCNTILKTLDTNIERCNIEFSDIYSLY